MRRNFFSFLLLSVLMSSQICPSSIAATHSIQQNSNSGDVKEWTLLVYLNGNNNLDKFGTMNVKQMEKIGSTPDLNIVTQWASLARGNTSRLYIVQDKLTSTVSSPVVQNMGNVDMGDWHSLVDFIQWGVKNYPAKHYFIDVWDHGSGWHAKRSPKGSDKSSPGSRLKPLDISWDENTGNSMTTLQLGTALEEAAKVIGHKVDLYASDACLMGMAEIADQLSDSVDFFGGSQEVEAAAGWPYDAILGRWVANPLSTPQEVAEILTEEYVKSYSGGQNGRQDATFAAYDLSKLPQVLATVAQFAEDLSKLKGKAKTRVIQIARKTQNFAYSDYGDLTDFAELLEKEQIESLDNSTLSSLKAALKDLIVSHASTSAYQRALGLSIWLPTNKASYDSYSKKYSDLKFESETHWGSALGVLLKGTHKFQ